MDPQRGASAADISKIQRYVDTICERMISTKDVNELDEGHIAAIRCLSLQKNQWLARRVGFDRVLGIVKVILGRFILKKDEKTGNYGIRHSAIRLVWFDCCYNAWAINYWNGRSVFATPRWRTGICESVEKEHIARFNDEAGLLFFN